MYIYAESKVPGSRILTPHRFYINYIGKKTPFQDFMNLLKVERF